MPPVKTGNEDNNNQGLTKEQVAIKELRTRIPDIISEDERFNDDFYLLQWLKAQMLNPEMAETMIRQSLQWRKENNIHTDLEKEFPPEFIHKYHMILSETKAGVPMGYINVGEIDIKGAIEEVGVERWIKYWDMRLAQMENHMIALNQAKNANTTDITSESTSGLFWFMDTKGFPANQLMNLNVITGVVTVASHLVKYFPQLFSNMICYNMNSTFAVLFNAMKAVFELAGTQVKVEAFDSDPNTWQERLLQITDLEHIEKLESSWKSNKASQI